MTAPKEHPAKFSKPVLDFIADLLVAEVARRERVLKVLDPFAGVGTLMPVVRSITHGREHCDAAGVELEPEWACGDVDVVIGDALQLFLIVDESTFDVVATSPCYGNRMADHHDAQEDSERHTYKHKLGRDPLPGSAAVLQWGPDYRKFHGEAIGQMLYALKGRAVDPDDRGLLIVNMSNHPRGGVEQRVVEWWVNELLVHGCYMRGVWPIETRRQRHGANGELRCENEFVIVCRPPKKGGLL